MKREFVGTLMIMYGEKKDKILKQNIFKGG